MTQDASQPNSLWIARKKAGLAQKAVARFLGKSVSQISEYEHGRLLPNLKTAFKLSVIYKTPVSDLYHELYARAKAEVDRSGCTVPTNKPPNSFYVYTQRAHFGD